MTTTRMEPKEIQAMAEVARDTRRALEEHFRELEKRLDGRPIAETKAEREESVAKVRELSEDVARLAGKARDQRRHWDRAAIARRARLHSEEGAASIRSLALRAELQSATNEDLVAMAEDVAADPENGRSERPLARARHIMAEGGRRSLTQEQARRLHDAVGAVQVPEGLLRPAALLSQIEGDDEVVRHLLRETETGRIDPGAKLRLVRAGHYG